MLILIKRLLIFIVLLINSQAVFAQTIELPKTVLGGISFNVEAENIPDSVKTIELNLLGESASYQYKLDVIDGNVKEKIEINNYGKYEIRSSLNTNQTRFIRVIPGWLSIIPPLLAILLALLIRQVVISLLAGIYVGAIFLYDFNPMQAFLRLSDTIILNVLVDADHMYVIVFTLLIGGVVGIISQNGGTAGLANQITKLAKKAKSGMIASWLMGIAIFFDDYANSLIIGNMMRPITDKLKISREKLAYIVDSTAAPVASIVIISTWIGYELGLISEGLKAIGSTESAYDVFIKTIPYRFYPIAAIFFVFLTSYMQRDFGPMFKAEKRARLNGPLEGDGVETEKLLTADDNLIIKKNGNWINSAIPILVILIGTIIGLFYTGMLNLETNGISDYSLQNIISYSDSFKSLLWASFGAGIVAVILTVSQKIMTIHESIDAWRKGIQSMLFAVLILVFAWGISQITIELKTADYIVSVLSDSINPRLLPVLVFIICGGISFATGTSWGTMAIVMPIVIPLASEVSKISGLSSTDTIIIIHGVISSVLAGSVFGDHCSPIADTTILSSMASQCNHISHVNTQLPYALIVGVFSLFLGSIPAGFGFNPFLSILLIFVGLFLFLRFVGKKV